MSLSISSCKKCNTCVGSCYSCRTSRGPTVGQFDTLCSKDFKNYDEFYNIVVIGDSLDCLSIQSTRHTYSSCDPNLPGGAICQ